MLHGKCKVSVGVIINAAKANICNDNEYLSLQDIKTLNFIQFKINDYDKILC